jgi:ABC-type uncharacterized transport system permease subunit
MYGGTAAAAVVPLFPFGRRLTVRRATLFLAVGGAAAHFAGLVAFAATYDMLPLEGLAPTLTSLAFMVALLGVGALLLTGEPSMMLVTLPMVAVPLVIALVAGLDVGAAVTSERGAWFVLHAGASLLGLALLGVAFVAAALYLGQHRALKQRHFGVVFRFFPPLEQLDRLNFHALVVGFPVLTVGIALAAAFADRSRGGFDVTAFHLGWGLFAWLVLGGAAVGRALGWIRGRLAAYVSVSGFLVIATLFVVLRAVIGSARFL